MTAPDSPVPTWHHGPPSAALDALGVADDERGVVHGAAEVRERFAWHHEYHDGSPHPTWLVAATADGDGTRLVWDPSADLPGGEYAVGTVVPPRRLAAITGWLAGVWPATASVRVLSDTGVLSGTGLSGDAGFLAGTDALGGGGVASDADVLAVVTDPAELDALRRETTTGRYTGGICRCPGNLTLTLHDAGGALLGTARLHGHGSVAWAAERFHNHLDVADPTALRLRLVGWGVPGQLAGFFMALAFKLDLVPDETGPDDPAPPAGATLTGILDWLGALPVPIPAFGPGGETGRRLLAAYPAEEIMAAVAGDPPPHRMLGAMNWAQFQPDDRPMARLLAPALRRLL
ncbi:hypothetical protein AB0J72_57485 [Dactylosporangium sp. NPDC049742]|uniref:hypothetical protein n=1 Tax=Dactylosporangium sp. NPDC049742 TaxID=3154737 RepID=UPI00344ACDDB